MSVTQPARTRLAPSPSGALHLGNARTFLVNWALARQRGWSIVMRIEDLDGPRIKRNADTQGLDDLAWLGLDWDGQPLYQSHDPGPYQRALEKLRQRDLIYPCRCTRSEISQAQSAPHSPPHGNHGELRYPGVCRPDPATGSSKRAHPPLLSDDANAWRLRVPDQSIAFDDVVAGRQRFNVQRQVGDFVVASKAGRPAYQLAVVVDDARQNVGHVIRGDDLLASTARQLWLYRLLQMGPAPCYYHLPLVVGEDGHRLAKRHGDTRLRYYRDCGVSPRRIVGLLAYWSGIFEDRQPIPAGDFVERFDLARLPRGKQVVFTSEDEKWLLDA